MPDESAKRRFVFSRPPVWLRNLQAESSASNTADDDDLPPWLQFEE
jgi:hypothetical protein